MFEAEIRGGVADVEKPPYWVECWPAAAVLADHLAENPETVRGRFCLDLGAGLGLVALVAASLGGRVVALDHHPDALRFLRRNARLNASDLEARIGAVAADWTGFALKPGSVERIFAADVLYERGFVEPVARFIDRTLAPDGHVFAADPDRPYGPAFLAAMRRLGFAAETVRTSPQTAPGAVRPTLVAVHRLVRE